MTASQAVPEARQCQDTTSYLFGAVAVNAGDNRWGVMDPNVGGHWGTDVEVENWAVLT